MAPQHMCITPVRAISLTTVAPTCAVTGKGLIDANTPISLPNISALDVETQIMALKITIMLRSAQVLTLYKPEVWAAYLLFANLID